MKHPSEEKSMEYLYGELSSPERKELETHLEDCSVCRHQLDRLSKVQTLLNDWTLEESPAKHRIVNGWPSGLKWAAVSLVLMSTAFATGRFSTPRIDKETLQAEVTKSVQQKIETEMRAKLQSENERLIRELRFELKNELAASVQEAAGQASAAAVSRTQEQLDKFGGALATLRKEDKQAILTTLQEIQNQHLKDVGMLRRELETVAYTTDESFRQAKQQLVQLASYNETNN
jgi:anti-sigma factor ChrR (cupin superfamily)